MHALMTDTPGRDGPSGLKYPMYPRIDTVDTIGII